MRVKRMKTMDGRIVKFVTPTTKEEGRQITEAVKQGKVSDFQVFGDWKNRGGDQR